MKGVVLAGGLGTRLHPMTAVVNKHLLDVYDEPMIFYPIRTLVEAGIDEIVLVTGRELDQFKELLGDGSRFGASLAFERQEGERGIADALSMAHAHLGDESMVVILGDNIYQESIGKYVQLFQQQKTGAKVLLKRVAPQDASRFAVAVLEDGSLKSTVEKPKRPPSEFVVTGCYMYDQRVFDIIDGLTLSGRGEYEITDVNNRYIEWGEMTHDILEGWWTDAGTPASKLKASILVALEKGVIFSA